MSETVKFPTTGINRYVTEYIRNLPDLKGKIVLDIPSGDGRASVEFLKRGATVKAFDLYPEFLKVDGIKAEFADLMEGIPLENGSVDYIICQEGIEHMPNQLGVLQEFNRVLRKGGTLLITTPNYSHLRSRLSHFLLESDYWKRMPPTEIDSIWFSEKDSNKLYFGHIFLLGIQYLQTISTISGFVVKNRIRTDIGNSSTILGVILYPLLVIMTLLSWLAYRNKNQNIDVKYKNSVLFKRVKLNLSYKTLLCKHIFWELIKKHEDDEIVQHLKTMKRESD
jgi:SAM-dependent methyltransferase